MTHKITTVVPTYNRPKELELCLRSVLAQSLPPHEVIVVDNGRTPLTKETIKMMEPEFFQKGIFLTYFENDVNSLTVAKNIGISKASGELVSFLDDDLILEPNYYEEMVRLFYEIPEALGVMGYNLFRGRKRTLKTEFISAYQRVFRLRVNGDSRFRVMPSLGLTYSDDGPVVGADWISGASTFTKWVLERIKPDSNLLKYSWDEDTDLSYRISKAFPGTLFMNQRAKYTHVDSQIRRAPNKEIIYMTEVYDLYLFYKDVNQTFSNKAVYLWSRIGRILLQSILLLTSSDRRERKQVFNVLAAPLYCIRHMRAIIRRDLSFFNDMLVEKR